MKAWHLLIPLMLSFLFSLVLVPVVRRYAIAKGIVARPKEDRWHKKETALLGGVGLYASFISSWGISYYLLGLHESVITTLPLILCSALIFLLGLFDDLRNITPQHKLAWQIIIASIFIFFGNRFIWTGSLVVDTFITLFWIVGITNAVNLLDNMDGLAAGISAITCISMGFLLYSFSSSPEDIFPNLIIIASLLGSIIGFLIFNFNPASIFMGDAGSLFLGFVLSTITITSQEVYIPKQGIAHIFAIVAAPVLLLLIPILDTTLVSIMRKLTGRKISQGGRDHSSHRLVAIGFTERQAVLALYGFSAASAIVAFLIQYVVAPIAILILGLFLISISLAWTYLARVKVYPEEEIMMNLKNRPFTSYTFTVAFKRRTFEVILDVFLITISYYTAYVLRFEGRIGGNLELFLRSLPILIVFQLGWFFFTDTYKGIWERIGIRDLFPYVKAVTLATISTMLLMVFLYRFESFSRAVFVIYWGIMLVLFSLSRLFFRALDERLTQRRQEGRPTLIYGAGRGGILALQEIENNKALGLKVIGFLDDNPSLWGKKLEGYPILGGLNHLVDAVKRHGVEEIIVSFKAADHHTLEAMRQSLKALARPLNIRKLKITLDPYDPLS